MDLACQRGREAVQGQQRAGRAGRRCLTAVLSRLAGSRLGQGRQVQQLGLGPELADWLHGMWNFCWDLGLLLSCFSSSSGRSTFLIHYRVWNERSDAR